MERREWRRSDETELDIARFVAPRFGGGRGCSCFSRSSRAAGTYFGLRFVDPLYTADTKILIEERESPLTRPREQTAASSAAEFDESAIQSQVEVMRSREIADAVIDKLDLTRRPEFDPARQALAHRRSCWSSSVSGAPGRGDDPPAGDGQLFQAASRSFRWRSRGSSASSSQRPNPVLAAEVANAVADAFVELQQDAKRQSAVAATEWLQQEIERLRGRVAEAEQAVADYRQQQRPLRRRPAQYARAIFRRSSSATSTPSWRAPGGARGGGSARPAVATLLAEGGSLEASAGGARTRS